MPPGLGGLSKPCTQDYVYAREILMESSLSFFLNFPSLGINLWKHIITLDIIILFYWISMPTSMLDSKPMISLHLNTLGWRGNWAWEASLNCQRPLPQSRWVEIQTCLLLIPKPIFFSLCRLFDWQRQNGLAHVWAVLELLLWNSIIWTLFWDSDLSTSLKWVNWRPGGSPQ